MSSSISLLVGLDVGDAGFQKDSSLEWKIKWLLALLSEWTLVIVRMYVSPINH